MSTPLADELMPFLEQGDRRRAADWALAQAADGTPLVQLVDDGLAVAMAEVGRRWERAVWTVADEHAATAVAEAALSAAAAEATPAAGRGGVVVACVEGDWHSLPSRMVAEVLDSGGWSVRFLGASQPTPMLVDHVATFRPSAVVLTCSVPGALPELALAIGLVHDLSLPVFVGGRALGTSSHRARMVGADGWAPCSRGALDLMEGLDAGGGVRPPAPSLVDPLATYRERAALVESWSKAAMDVLAALMPAVATYPDATWERTRADLAHLIEVASLSLLVEDQSLVDEQVAWLIGILAARQVDERALERGLRALVEAQPSSVRAGPVAGVLHAVRLRLGTLAPAVEPTPA